MNMNETTFPNEVIETKEDNTMNTITISLDEYRTLIRTAMAFEILRELASKYDYHSDVECAIYGFENKPKQEAENDGV